MHNIEFLQHVYPCNSVLCRVDKRNTRRNWRRELGRRDDNLSIMVLLVITYWEPTTERQTIDDSKNNIRHVN